ncbi:NAD(P)H-dependent glycerol-3-phosphate dehydrogenase [Fimbriiglobus ruber]|uniref:Glycerol-3-phosphate dehydrogenase [NAD(P)+] n=1 Tax=Fimbriiglobus ruber TaxID=1908690 RepID=A0A225E0G0_9BACT|nr:NAD(P)H-dependent glycerol-3-phosphate dehydrogenase [Fimbriiglobus ruber]OWK47220.1 glycerol-3-phosphate dehydrogenase [Fimbriiglobus ruber]
MATFAVLGSGGWGTAIAVSLAQKAGNRVRLWCARSETCRVLRETRVNDRQLAGIPIPPTITITDDPGEATESADCWIAAVPTAFLRSTAIRWKPFARETTPVVSLTKGIETTTFRRPTEILEDVLGVTRLVAVSGPSHAEEVARGMPTSVVAASPDAGLAGWVQAHLGSERLRVYTNADLIGVELAGALKNVIGIAAGCCDGLKFGDNAKAAMLTRGLVEMTRFGVAHGADPATFAGLAGLGDLITTCFSPHGRNRRVGERLARGDTLADVQSGPQVAEGVYTAKSVYDRVTVMGLEVPIMAAVYQVLYTGKPAVGAVSELLSRRQRGENTVFG